MDVAFLETYVLFLMVDVYKEADTRPQVRVLVQVHQSRLQLTISEEWTISEKQGVTTCWKSVHRISGCLLYTSPSPRD